MPCTEGQSVNITIDDLNHRGEGVGRFNGFTLFVPGALPGEHVSVRIAAVHKKFGEANLQSIAVASAYRIRPYCPYFNRCGGCQLQHLSYEKQLTWKQEMIYETLLRIAGIKTAIRPVLGMENPWSYRNKAQIHFGLDNGRVIAGFYERESHNLITINDCPVQSPLNNRALTIIGQSLQQYVDSLPKQGRQKLPVSGAQVRSSYARNNCLITFRGATAQDDLSNLENVAAFINAELGEFSSGIGVAGRNKKGVFLKKLSGQLHLDEYLEPFHYRISPQSFFQINPLQAGVLYKEALLLAGNPATAYDLYCGTGNFSLYLSRTAEKVIGIDSEKAAIEDARFNATLNSINNITFINKPAEDVTSIVPGSKRPVTVFLNPPRKGCPASLLETVIKAKPERIVYISCNPATLARDLAVLVKHGFNLQQVQPVDMFPHTSHLETIALLTQQVD